MNQTATAARAFQINNMMEGNHDMVIHAAGCSSANSQREARINNSWNATGATATDALNTEIDKMNKDFGPGTWGLHHFHVMPCAK